MYFMVYAMGMKNKIITVWLDSNSETRCRILVALITKSDMAFFGQKHQAALEAIALLTSPNLR